MMIAWKNVELIEVKLMEKIWEPKIGFEIKIFAIFSNLHL